MSLAKSYRPVGRCIYCGSPEWSAGQVRKLGDEHIIPEGLGGKLLLPEASCKDCEGLTSKFELEWLRSAFYTVRVQKRARKEEKAAAKISSVAGTKKWAYNFRIGSARKISSYECYSLVRSSRHSLGLCTGRKSIIWWSSNWNPSDVWPSFKAILGSRNSKFRPSSEQCNQHPIWKDVGENCTFLCRG